MKEIKVKKRDGRLEPIDLSKIHRVLTWAAEDLDNVSVSEVELRAHVQFYEAVKTSDIHEMLIKSAADLISEETPDYQKMAARLNMFHLRKMAYGQYIPPRIYEHVKKMVHDGYYDEDLLKKYSREDFDELEKVIKHDRDLDLAYAATKQMEGKYLVQNRATKEIKESPQMLYMLVAMTLFMDEENKENRLTLVKDFYESASLHRISLPTPIMSGARTPIRQFSSCVVIDCGDSLDSINATTSAIVKYISKKAGIGLNIGRIRALGSEINKGAAVHTGLIPFIKMFQSAVKSCSQGGVRGGAATSYYPIWHLEVEGLLVLKNNRGVEDNRARHLDYGVQINKFFYQRLIKGGDITLFSPHDVEDLYQAFYQDQDKFEKLYLKYEQDPNIRKKTVKAIDLFSSLMQERSSTGRIYIMNVDNANDHSAFNKMKAPVYLSNLCLVGDTKVKILVDDKEQEIELKALNELYKKNKNIKVLSFDTKNNKEEYQAILGSELMQKNADIVRVTDEKSGFYIEGTPDHEVYTKNRGYVKIKDLKEDDELQIRNEL